MGFKLIQNNSVMKSKLNCIKTSNWSGTSTYQFEHVDVFTEIVTTDKDPIVTDLFIHEEIDNSEDISERLNNSLSPT